MKAAVGLGATGFALIAVCYGFARFAFGLFLPEIRTDLSLSPDLGGLIAGGSFLGYCLAISVSAYLTERCGPQPVAAMAGVVAAVGLFAIALSNSAWMLAVAVLFAGLSTGLASPPLAAAVAVGIPPADQSATNTAINAGTSAGVALSGPLALYAGAGWRTAFAAYGVLALLVVVAVVTTIPRGHGGAMSPARDFRLPSDVAKLAFAAFVMGMASTAVWSFGGELVSGNHGWEQPRIGMLWTVVGVSGAIGGFAGILIARTGLNTVHRVSLAAIAVGLAGIGFSGTKDALIWAGAALFGASYIMLTGVYLIWGVSLMEERPATGLTAAFLSIAIGQTVGAPLFGVLFERASPDMAVAVFACLVVLAGICRAQRIS